MRTTALLAPLTASLILFACGGRELSLGGPAGLISTAGGSSTTATTGTAGTSAGSGTASAGTVTSTVGGGSVAGASSAGAVGGSAVASSGAGATGTGGTGGAPACNESLPPVAPLSPADGVPLRGSAIVLRNADLFEAASGMPAGTIDNPDALVLVVGDPPPTCNTPYPPPAQRNAAGAPCGPAWHSTLTLPANLEPLTAYGANDALVSAGATYSSCAAGGGGAAGSASGGGGSLACDPASRVELVEVGPGPADGTQAVFRLFGIPGGGGDGTTPGSPNGTFVATVCPVANPCASKPCGDTCSICSTLESCSGPQRGCNGSGACIVGTPVCNPPSANAKECPAAAPTSGTACPIEGLSCGWGRCGTICTCGPAGWQCASITC